jgi:glycosyltransferase involved in cell wall biosynthesis
MQPQQASFTIVTPNYNNGRFLAQTIESVLANLQPGDEYFVVDGGSSDESLQIIKRYESRLTGWLSGPDRGYADAISKGFKLGRGDLLAWINSSDLLLPGALSVARQLLLRNQADLLFGDDYHIAEDGIVLFRSCGAASSFKKLMLHGGWAPLQDACFWTRSIYERVGGVNPDTKFAADFEFFLKIAIVGTSVYAPVAFSAFRKHTGQISISASESYRSERRAILKKAQSIECVSPIERIPYYAWVRLRARVFQSFLNSKAHAGQPIGELHAN